MEADAEAATFAVLDEADRLVYATPGLASAEAPLLPSEGGGKAVDAVEADFGRRGDETHKQYLQREFSALKPFVIISLSYMLFTTTDGAVRMIVLLHAYALGFSAWQTAIMFSMYELAGVVTNLLAGLMGARWGIKSTLLTGLALQLCGIGMLFGWQSSWAAEGQVVKGIVFVTAAQMLCGVAKDLTKLGGKTVTKLVTPDERQSRLFKVVSFITGWKNSMKGVGYFIGAAALTLSYPFALGLLLILIAAAIPWAAVGLSNQLGRARKENLRLSAIFRQRYNVNVLSAARFFLFGSRDLWFEVPLPFFLRDAVYGLGWERVAVGAMLAAFIILYGQVQSWTPQLVLQPLRQSPANKYVELLWNAVLTLAPAMLAVAFLGTPLFTSRTDLGAMTGVLLAGLLAYCCLFAINSSIHSYLIVRYADGDKAALNVGFYYMANALGRLAGTLASGALYDFAGSSPVYGLGWCFVASVAFAVVSTAVTAALRDNVGGLRCGACLTLVRAPPPAAAAAAASQPSQPSAPSQPGQIVAPVAPSQHTSLASAVATLLSPAADLAAAAPTLAGRRVLLRADLNCPLNAAGTGLADASRLDAVLPTLRLLLDSGARVALASHLGRPEAAPAAGRAAAFSLAPVAACLAQRLPPGAFAGLAPDCVGPAASSAVEALRPGQVCLLENLRLHPGEAANDASFAAQLAALVGGEAYVSDAFGVVHRDQASVTGMLPHMARAFPGLLLRRELRYLSQACTSPTRPFGVIVGGAKVKDKLPLLASLMETADVILIGGRMAFTFLAAEGVAVGATQIEPDWLEACRDMRALAARRGVRLLLPCDVVVARSMDDDAGCCCVPLTTSCCSQDAPCVPEGCFGLDIGPETCAAFAEAVMHCKTVFWNGPMGRFELPGFAAGTEAVARALGAATEAGCTTIVGGGDSVSAVKRLRPPPRMTFLSTGGGASLELIRGRLLPGLAALADAVARQAEAPAA